MGHPRVARTQGVAQVTRGDGLGKYVRGNAVWAVSRPLGEKIWLFCRPKTLLSPLFYQDEQIFIFPG